jgi:hypothetical protein
VKRFSVAIINIDLDNEALSPSGLTRFIRVIVQIDARKPEELAHRNDVTNLDAEEIVVSPQSPFPDVVIQGLNIRLTIKSAFAQGATRFARNRDILAVCVTKRILTHLEKTRKFHRGPAFHRRASCLIVEWHHEGMVDEKRVAFNICDVYLLWRIVFAKDVDVLARALVFRATVVRGILR